MQIVFLFTAAGKLECRANKIIIPLWVDVTQGCSEKGKVCQEKAIKHSLSLCFNLLVTQYILVPTRTLVCILASSRQSDNQRRVRLSLVHLFIFLKYHKPPTMTKYK